MEWSFQEVSLKMKCIHFFCLCLYLSRNMDKMVAVQVGTGTLRSNKVHILLMIKQWKTLGACVVSRGMICLQTFMEERTFYLVQPIDILGFNYMEVSLNLRSVPKSLILLQNCVVPGFLNVSLHPYFPNDLDYL